MLVRFNRIEEAQTYLETAIRLDPSLSVAHSNLVGPNPKP